ncbi:YgiT-type zinc finger protein [Methanospirillum hungatei]|nr:YgiT-type zinc finger protein [Methanospirillum hungatei]
MYCKNENLKNDLITKSYEKEGVVTVISGVPVLICDACGQEYLA